MKLRTDVFFVEQKVDEEELDWRDAEDTSEHFWISDDAGTAAYLRVLVDEKPSHRDARHVIGRVVVRADRRGEGLAQVLLRDAVARYGAEAMMLHAQVYAAPLYVKFGFIPFGDAYLEAGLAHQLMYRAADAASLADTEAVPA